LQAKGEEVKAEKRKLAECALRAREGTTRPTQSLSTAACEKLSTFSPNPTTFARKSPSFCGQQKQSVIFNCSFDKKSAKNAVCFGA
jgi:hypothetical protein